MPLKGAAVREGYLSLVKDRVDIFQCEPAVCISVKRDLEKDLLSVKRDLEIDLLRSKNEQFTLLYH